MLVTYSDYLFTTQNTNPIVLDSRGECDMFLVDDTYKFVLNTALDVTIWSVDNILISTTTIPGATTTLWNDVNYKTFADTPITVVDGDAGSMFSVDCTSGNVVFTLPDIAGLTLGSLPWAFGIKKTDSSSNTITINRASTDTIDGATSLVISRQHYGAILIPDASPSPDEWTSQEFGKLTITGDIVGTTDTQTLTAKTIVVASNTITTAANGNLTSTELNAALAELQTDIDTRALDADLTTHENDTTNPHSVTKAQVGLTNVDNTSDATKNTAVATLSGKTFSDAVTLTEIATPSTPGSGLLKIYPKTDKKMYKLDDTGSETEMGTGGSGGSGSEINYITNQDYESGVANVTTTANVTETQETTSPLIGTGSLKLAIGTGATTADYADLEMNLVDPAYIDVSKSLTISFLIDASDTNYSSDDVQFVLRNKTGGADIALVHGTDGKILANSNIQRFTARVGTIASINDYALRMNVLVAPSVASVLYIDKPIVSPDILIPSVLAGVETKYNRTSTQTITPSVITIVDFSSKVYDIENLVTTGASWQYTVPRSGKYDIYGNVSMVSTTMWGLIEYLELYVYVGGAKVSTLDRKSGINTGSGAASLKVQGLTTLDLIAGDLIDIRIWQNTGLTLNTIADGTSCYMFINEHTKDGAMISSADTLVSTQKARMTSTLAPTFATGVKTKATWNTVGFDDFGMASTANDRMDILENGNYEVKFAYFFTSIASTNNGSIQTYARINGTTDIFIGATGYPTGVTQFRDLNVSGILNNLSKGDYVEIFIAQDIVTTLTAHTGLNHYTIERRPDFSIFASYGEGITNDNIVGSAWNPVSTDWKLYYNDFACDETITARGYGGGTIGFVTLVTGTGAVMGASSTIYANRYGAQTLGVGTSAGAITGYELDGDKAYSYGDARIKFGCAIKLLNLMSGTENYTMHIGAGNAVATFTTKQAQFLMNYSVNTTNILCSSRGTSLNNADSGTAFSTSWVNLEIDIAADLSSIKYYIDGVLVHTESTAANIPASGDAINFQIAGRSATTTIVNKFEVDWAYIAIKPTSTRGSITTWIGV